MAINNSLTTGVNGVLAQSQKINSISDNIANVNTVGYKESITEFYDLFQQSGSTYTSTRYGALGKAQQQNNKQGIILQSAGTTDLAINGNGFFAVTGDATATTAPSLSELYFTRAGSFTPDENGNLRNAAGYYLLGWPLDASGILAANLESDTHDSASAISSLSLVNLNDTASVPTSRAKVQANLSSGTESFSPFGNIAFTAIPADGETITINGVVWTFVTTGATGNQTNIGSTLSATLTNLANDLNNSTNPLLTPATYNDSGTGQLDIYYDPLNTTPAAMFLYDAGTTTATATALLDYDAATTNMASGAITPSYSQAIEIVDNNGETHQVSLSFLKTGINTWQMEMIASPANDVISPDGLLASGSFTFNGDGGLASVSSSLTGAIAFPWTDTGLIPANALVPKTDNSIVFDWGTPGVLGVGAHDGIYQTASSSSVRSVVQDGHGAGTLVRVEVDDKGIINGIYSNGTRVGLYAVPLTTFNNAEGLDSITGNIYTSSETSGLINMFLAGTGGTGSLRNGALESSTVDLAGELTNMIVAQRAYQSNTKSITTSDDMLQTLTRMLG